MKLAVMQPYLFPYIGYLSLMAEADVFVVFDSAQFIDKGWINRNRLLHPNEQKEWQYFTLPIKNKRNLESIRNLEINSETDFFSNIRGKLSFLKKRAPFYQDAIRLIDAISDSVSGVTRLAEFNAISLAVLERELELQCKIVSEESIFYEPQNVNHSGQWALEIASAAGALEYINPISGSHLFNNEEFQAKDIKLRFLESRDVVYSQRRDRFVPDLSILDCVMWCGLKEASRLIKTEYRIHQGV